MFLQISLAGSASLGPLFGVFSSAMLLAMVLNLVLGCGGKPKKDADCPCAPNNAPAPNNVSVPETPEGEEAPKSDKKDDTQKEVSGAAAAPAEPTQKGDTDSKQESQQAPTQKDAAGNSQAASVKDKTQGKSTQSAVGGTNQEKDNPPSVKAGNTQKSAKSAIKSAAADTQK